SFGSSYFQNKHFLKKLSTLKWTVVEQKHFVEDGKISFTDEHLDFAYQVDDIPNTDKPHCLLLSSVLQYLEDPDRWLEKFFAYQFPYIIIDRTAFINDKQRLTVQSVPEFIYKASYPCWFFNEDEFLLKFSTHYELIADFDSFADPNKVTEDGKQLYWKGFFFKQK
ncbi:MAG: methyltransferase, TIGR04325 family, partial [Sphingobacteriales bacterium]